MRFANVRELKIETNKVLDLSKKRGPIVVTRRGKPVALLRSITENDFMINIGSLWKRIRQSAEQSGFKSSDVEKLVKQIRTSK